MSSAELTRHAGRNEAETRMLASLSLTAPWELIEAFSRFPRWQPEAVNAAAEMIADRLRRLTVPVTVHAPEIYLSVPLDASVDADGQTFRAKPPSMSVSVPDGVTGELVYLPANQKALRSYAKNIAELFGRPATELKSITERLRGRILITEGFGNPALTQIVEEWGGIGLIAINPGVDIHWGTCTTIWGSPDPQDSARKPRIPVVAVNNPDGQKLLALARDGGEATIRTDMLEGWFMQKVPVVTIPGTEEPEKFVLVHGHYDSWDVGVGDNATGDATLLELARVLWTHRAGLRRSVKLAWWPGHSTGRYAGSTWFADAFALDLDRNCLAQINCDSPGCRWATSYHDTRSFSECGALATQAIRDIVPDAEVATHRPPQAGDYSFNNIGLPSFFMLSSTMPNALREEKGYYDVSGCGGNIAWHTENDRLEIADRDILLTDMKIYLLSALRIANAEVLPFDWSATCDEFLTTIARYEKASQGMADLSPSRRAIETLKAALARLDAAPVAARNTVLMELARILVPLNYTREPRFRHDPAYTVPRLPTLAVAADLPQFEDAHERRCAAVELTRGQNRFLAAMERARRLVDTATGRQ